MAEFQTLTVCTKVVVQKKPEEKTQIEPKGQGKMQMTIQNIFAQMVKNKRNEKEEVDTSQTLKFILEK